MPSTAIATLTTRSTRAARDTALAALIGGNLFGRVGMDPALRAISDKTERGKVLNRAWRRYGMVNSAALGVLVAERVQAHRASRPSFVDDAAVGAVVVTGLAAALGGMGFADQASGGAVAMQSGHDTAPETPARAARIKRAVNTLGALNLAAELVLLARGARP